MTDLSPTEAIFFAALEKTTSEERAAYLDESCTGQPELRARVEKLLAAQPRVGGFLEPAPTDQRASAAVPTRQETIGTVLDGKYKLVEVIGDGGMGIVYMAQQTTPVKRVVAVKVIKAGMDTKAVLARFEAERQALALMDHVNIARVFDAGTTEFGRPYFIMELVKGVPITQYCDEMRLTLRQRLELFVPVCQAIQHAHMKGVIHRDIKPSNVLVAMYDDRPVPKVIDFGVAKATGQTLTEKTLLTGFGTVIGTPEYMSPEQANLNNRDIDTRSDVYSLGVLLYELFTGTPPFAKSELEKKGFLEILRTVREDEPMRPSVKLGTTEALPTLSANRGTEPKKLTESLRSELDWIVLKALNKNRDRRYESANGFAADVTRYLTGDAVEAHPPTRAYRAKKFATRHHKTLAVALSVFSILFATTFISLWSYIHGYYDAKHHREETQLMRERSKIATEVAKRQKETVDDFINSKGETWLPDDYKHLANSLCDVYVQIGHPKLDTGPKERYQFLRNYASRNAPLLSDRTMSPAKEYLPSLRYAAAVRWGYGLGFQRIHAQEDAVKELEKAAVNAKSGFGNVDEITLLIQADLAYSLHRLGQDHESFKVIQGAHEQILQSVRNNPILLDTDKTKPRPWGWEPGWQSSWRELLSIVLILGPTDEMRLAFDKFCEERAQLFRNRNREMDKIYNQPGHYINGLSNRLTKNGYLPDLETVLRLRLSTGVFNPSIWNETMVRYMVQVGLAENLIAQNNGRLPEAEKLLLDTYQQSILPFPERWLKEPGTTTVRNMRMNWDWQVTIPAVRQLIVLYKIQEKQDQVKKWTQTLQNLQPEMLPRPRLVK